ncbi:MAG: hypothetical protein K9H61_09560 [Bacteroidia bacterium]|nr:hypothetical protein [Bacteroidia bacterium]MCF8447227.1 hypothetical protein [Bacteroidia bacterium]
MKKGIFFFFIVLFGLNLSAQTKVDTVYFNSRNGIKRINKITQSKGNHSKVTVFNEQGTKTEYFELLDGKVEGKYIVYNRNGLLYKTTNYNKGLKEGLEIIYFVNSKKKAETNYSSNYKMGPFKIWNEAGTLIQKGTYDTLYNKVRQKEEFVEVLTGKYESYFENGAKAKQCTYIKGKLNGLNQEWYGNGKQKLAIEYKNGLINGKEESWYENGNKQFEGKSYREEGLKGAYIKPNYEGKQIRYHENGKISSVQTYQNFLPNGIWLKYSQEGILIEQKAFENGQLSNPDITYHSNGKVYQINPRQFFNIDGRDTSLIHGLVQTYYANGNKQQEINYVRGKQYGLYKQFFDNGNVGRELYFFGASDRYAVLKEYNSDGVLLKEGTYSKEPNDSTKFKKLIYAIYAENGNLLYRLNQKDAMANGVFEAYYENGNLKAEGFIFKRRNSDYFSVEDVGNAWQAIYYPNGGLRYEILSIDNFRHGQYVEWFPDGSLKRFNNPTGLDVQWLQNGELMMALVYNSNNNLIRDTVLDSRYLKDLYESLRTAPTRQLKILKQSNGLQTSYYAPGKKRFETNLNNGNFENYFLAYTFSGDTLAYLELQDGLLHGYYLVKNANGTYFLQGNYEQGKEVGEWKQYSRKGLPRAFFEYDKNGMGHKPYTYEFTFYESGVIESEVHFKEGKRDGWLIGYHPNGRVRDSAFYKLDTLWGTIVSYSEDGKPYRRSTYVGGKKQGIDKSWYYREKGSGLMKEEQYVKDVRNGEARYYYPNGKLNLIAFFKDGKDDSTWIYYDTLGNISRTVYYENGIKKEQPLVGNCPCKDKDTGKGFGQSLSSLLNDETDISLWQFPYHESIEPIIDFSFFRNLQTSNNRSSSFYSFNLIAFKPIQVAIPNKNGMKLWLNACWHQGEESSLEMAVSFTERQPDITRVEIGSNRMAYLLPSKLFKSTTNNQKDVLAQFTLSSLTYDRNGIKFNHAKPICVDDAFLLNSNYFVQLDTFNLVNVGAMNDKDYLPHRISYFGYDLMASDLLKVIGTEPILLNEAAGKIKINLQKNSMQGTISHVMITPKLLAGNISIPDVLLVDGKLSIEKNGESIFFTEKELYAQMKMDGFSKIIGHYNPEKKVLEILFYIHKP